MERLHITIRCQGPYREVIVGDTVGTACFVRELVGQILVTLYEQARIDDIAVQFLSFPPTPDGDYCVIHMQARCLGQRWRLYDEQEMEVLIEVNIGLPLIELFGSVTVEVFSSTDVS